MKSVNTFDPIWNDLHKTRMPTDTWPMDDMIRQVARHIYGAVDRSSVRVLDLGCGSGCMTWFLARAGFDVYAVDASFQAVEHCQKRIQKEQLQAQIQVADFLNLPFPDNFFDVVLEIHVFTCVPTDLTRQFVQEVYRVLKPGCVFMSRTPADDCTGNGLGEYVEKNVWKDAPTGPFAHMGVARFTSREDVPSIYAPFSIKSIDKSSTTLDNGEITLSSLIISAQKI